MTTFIIIVAVLVGLAVISVREIRRDGLGQRRPPRGPGDDWTVGKLPSHPYGA